MVFTSSVFLFLFFPALILLYYFPLLREIKIKNAILLISSLIFYAWGEPIYVFLMLFSIAVTYFLGLGLDKYSRKKCILISGISYHIIVLFIFKYLAFIVKEADLLFQKKEQLSIAVPIGISFFTFQLLSYLFDVYYKKVAAQRNIFYLALYVAFFPQLIAGPIVRYNQIEEQIMHRELKIENFSMGMERFIYGMGKKVLIANYVAYISDRCFGIYRGESVMLAWLGAIAYTLQIYFDFSGYSDMAIGLGKMFGFQFSENFNYPYLSKSITEFWRRWHISLSSWFRDYVYIPLGGNRVCKAKWYRNLFIVWLLTGIWHGANWTFLMWGLCYFLLLIIEKSIRVKDKIQMDSSCVKARCVWKSGGYFMYIQCF